MIQYQIVLNSRGGWYSGYIMKPLYYFEAITVSCQFLLSGIITNRYYHDIDAIMVYWRISLCTKLYKLSKDGRIPRWIYSCLVSCSYTTGVLQYSSRLSLHSRVPFTHVSFNFIRVICRNSCVTRELDFLCCTRVTVEYYTRVRLCMFCTRVRFLYSARE